MKHLLKIRFILPVMLMALAANANAALLDDTIATMTTIQGAVLTLLTAVIGIGLAIVGYRVLRKVIAKF
jgi:hypothetical protein